MTVATKSVQTANRFGEKNFGPLVSAKPLHGGGQLIEVAAEARTSDLANFESLRAKQIRIHQVRRLIVGDNCKLVSPAA